LRQGVTHGAKETNVDSPPRSAVSLPALLRLAWPIVFSRLSQTIIGLSDALFVASLGPAALAAVATGAFNAFTLLILPVGVMYMVSSFSAQLHGRGDGRGARRFAWYGLAVAAVTQLVCVAVLPTVGWALGLLPYDESLKVLMARFLGLRLLGGGAAVGLEALANYYGGLGRTRPGMVANLAAMVLNVLGNWILIEGHLGAPAMGVAGSALASALATSAAFLGFFGYFLREAPQGPLGLQAAELWRLLRFGVPSGFNWLFEFLGFMFFVNVVVAGLGTTALAAMNAVILLNTVSFMPAFGVASAGAILVGHAIGAGRPDEVPRAVRVTLQVAVTWQGLVGLTYLAVPGLLMAPFARGAEAAELTAVGVRMLLVSAAWQVFDATATTLAEALRAAGDTLFPTLARLLISWLVFAPGAYLCATRLHWTEVGSTAWLAGYLALLAAVLAWRYRSGAWRRVRLLEGSPR
jgi:multidrug resistance protein, MATE family